MSTLLSHLTLLLGTEVQYLQFPQRYVLLLLTLFGRVSRLEALMFLWNLIPARGRIFFFFFVKRPWAVDKAR